MIPSSTDRAADSTASDAGWRDLATRLLNELRMKELKQTGGGYDFWHDIRRAAG